MNLSEEGVAAALGRSSVCRIHSVPAVNGALDHGRNPGQCANAHARRAAVRPSVILRNAAVQLRPKANRPRSADCLTLRTASPSSARPSLGRGLHETPYCTAGAPSVGGCLARRHHIAGRGVRADVQGKGTGSTHRRARASGPDVGVRAATAAGPDRANADAGHRSAHLAGTDAAGTGGAGRQEADPADQHHAERVAGDNVPLRWFHQGRLHDHPHQRRRTA